MDRLDITAPLVAGLVARQFPHWAHLPVRPVPWNGWDNATFLLGDAMTVRLPTAERYKAAVEKEQLWLPRLAPLLPLPIPAPISEGRPDATYPFAWSINRFIPGETTARERIGDLVAYASDLAGFLKALHRIDARVGPRAGPHNFHRGGDLAVYDAETRRCIARLGERIDGAAATACWETALASHWTETPVWVHGDIAVGNLLVAEGKLRAVIDWGTSGVGDPASDLVIAWTFFDGESRAAFRDALSLDADSWARARGWALWKALLVTAENGNLHPAETPAETVIGLILDDYDAGLDP